MPGVIPGYNYDIFISYRQKDNKGEHWVSEFVESLKTELESTFKEEISVYFDINPHDGLLETHDVGESLKEKLKCLVFIPVISRTYCDPKSFAWEHEFRAFVEQASKDQFGLKVKLPNGNVASRVLPVQIHEINPDDRSEIEKVLGGIMRPVEFIYKEPGVNRPLRSNEEHPDNNLNKTLYRNQINKVANAIDEILTGLKNFQSAPTDEKIHVPQINEAEESQIDQVEKNRRARFSKSKIISGISLIVLALGAAVIILLVGPGKEKSINAMTYPVTVINENGEKEVRRVFKDEYIAKLAIFPFANEKSDPSSDWLQHGLMVGIGWDIDQFNYAFQRQGDHNALRLQEQIKYSKTNNLPYFLTGSFSESEGIYRVKSKLYETGSGSVIIERAVSGDDILAIIDTISLQVRRDLGISKKLLNSAPDLPVREHLTANPDAFRHFARAIFFNSELKIDSMLMENYNAIILDTTFSLALCYRAIVNHWFHKSQESAMQDINQAMRHRWRLTESNSTYTRIYNYTIHDELDKTIRLLEMQYELHPGKYDLLLELVYTYKENLMFQQYEKASLLLNKLLPDHPDYQILLADSYLLSGKYDEGLDLINELLKYSPEKIEALMKMGQLYLHKNEFQSAGRCYEKVILLQPESEKNLSKMLDHISYSQSRSSGTDYLESFIGCYKSDDYETSLTSLIHNHHLIIKARNQPPAINYPVSDNEFTTEDGVNILTFLRNDKGIVIKADYQKDGRSMGFFWKEDSLILRAIELLDGQDKIKALSAFREAYAVNDDHYYLANFIRHLEYITSDEYKSERNIQAAWCGNYSGIRIFMKNDILYYENNLKLIYKLLPVSSDQFISQSFYNRTFRIIMDKNKVKGVEILYTDGKREFFPKADQRLL